jgi:DNA repair exonuclease SbcCD ATPase subunit
MGRHLLYETALLDTQTYEILNIDEVDELKKEQTRLKSRIDAANRKLVLESKVKEAAQNIHRLYSKRGDRSDTPQSPDSPMRDVDGLLKRKGRDSSDASQNGRAVDQAQDELAMSIKAVDELNEQIKTLLERKQTVERTLLRHTAAVLAEQASQATNNASSGANGFNFHDDSEALGYAPDEFDGIRDILKGMPGPSGKQGDVQRAQEDHERKLADMQIRLEHLNSQLRGVIVEASRSRGAQPEPEPEGSRGTDVNDRLEGVIAALQSNVRTIELEQQHQAPRAAVEQRLSILNNQLHNMMQLSSDLDTPEFPQPPHAHGQGYQQQLQQVEGSLTTMEKVIRQYNNELQSAREASGSASKAIKEAQSKSEKASEYETVISGLWTILSLDNSAQDSTDDTASPPMTPIRENFSLQAFNARVQHIFDVAKGAKVQQDILRRQIQQQRDLNGKSDMEKHAELEVLQGRYDELSAAFDATQLELAKTMASNEQGEREVNESRSEMVNVMNELDQLRKTIDETQARQKEVDSRSAQLAADNTAAQQAYADIQQEMEILESEVVRLTTELTVAKADLDGAYGTRQERKKEAGVAEQDMEALEKLKDQEIEALRKSQSDHIKLLETELEDMMSEFQAMARESLEMEKERGQLEGMIDSLKEKCDELEAQLADEKVASIGIKSPADGGPRESTSVMVLRQEFKRMMREARAEGIRALRVRVACQLTDAQRSQLTTSQIEQEERRKIEADLRRHRQAAGPLGRQGLVAPLSPRPNSRSSHSRSGTLLSNNGSTAVLANGARESSIPETNEAAALATAAG